MYTDNRLLTELYNLLSTKANSSGVFESISMRVNFGAEVTSNAFINYLVLMLLRDSGFEDSALYKKLKHKITQTYIKHKLTLNYHFENPIYPDDLDDTFVGIYGLDLLNNRRWDYIELLLKNSIEFGGPYHTWITKNQEDPDLFVNANILYTLIKSKLYPEGLIKFLNRLVQNGSLESKYYSNLSFKVFLLSRVSEVLTNKSNSKLFSIIENALSNKANLDKTETTYLLLSLQFLKRFTPLYSNTLNNLRRDPNFVACGELPISLFIERSVGGVNTYVGSFAVDTAAKMLLIHKNSIITAENRCRKILINHHQKFIVKPTLPIEISTGMVNSFMEPTYLFNSFPGEVGNSIPKDMVDTLAMLNVVGFSLFTDLDNFLDESKGNIFVTSLMYKDYMKSYLDYSSKVLDKYSHKSFQRFLVSCIKALTFEYQFIGIVAPGINKLMLALLSKGKLASISSRFIIYYIFSSRCAISNVFSCLFDIQLIIRQYLDDLSDYFDDTSHGVNVVRSYYSRYNSISVESYFKLVLPKSINNLIKLDQLFMKKLCEVESELGTRFSYFRRERFKYLKQIKYLRSEHRDYRSYEFACTGENPYHSNND